MPPFWRRAQSPSPDVADLVKAEVEKALDLAGAKVTDVRSQMAALTTGRQSLLSTYFEAMPWSDPDAAFGPGRPIAPAAIDPVNERGRTEPRTYQYPVAWNLQIGEQRHVPFTILRKAADVDLVRRCIEIRKADIVGLAWDITLSDNAVRVAMDRTNERNRARAALAMRGQFEDQIAALKTFWSKPDRLNNLTFSQWLSAVLEEVLVTDALSIYAHPKKGGGPIVAGLNSGVHSLRILDGSTIKPLLNHLGNTPSAPEPAYQQVLYGFPRGEYTYDPEARGEMTADTLMYRPRNRRVISPYGLPPVEQALAFIDIWLKRQEWLREEYRSGSMPEVYLKILDAQAAGITNPQQRRDWEKAINDDLSGQTAERVQMHVGLPGTEPMLLAQFAEKYKSDFDDTLALRIAAFFDVMGTQLNITPKGGLGGKGHQEGEESKSEAQARMPTVNFLVDLLNDLSIQYLGAPEELTFTFRSLDEDDVSEVSTSRQVELFSAQQTLNDIMAETGRPLFDFAEADMPFVLAPGAPLTFLEGASVAPVTPIGADDPSKLHKPTDPTEPPGPPQLDISTLAEKAAEAAAYKRFTSKAHSREFVWKHHAPDEVKALEADIAKAPDDPKASARDLPGEEFRSALEAHYAPLIAKALTGSTDGIRETVERRMVHKDVTPAEQFAAEAAIQAGVTIDRAELVQIVRELYADAYLAGGHTAMGQLGSGATLSGNIAGYEAAMDWDSWSPGHAAAALKDADGGLAALLADADVTIRGITDSAMARLGNALAAGLAAGDSTDTISRSLEDLLGDATSADRVAVTETARAMTQASLDAYRANGVEQWDWLLTAGACPACEDEWADNPHGIDDSPPPEHPNCRCAVAPVNPVTGEEGEGE
jgi:SPP1 gp7 family putative phage head morphogenesis protein